MGWSGDAFQGVTALRLVVLRREQSARHNTPAAHHHTRARAQQHTCREREGGDDTHNHKSHARHGDAPALPPREQSARHHKSSSTAPHTQ